MVNCLKGSTKARQGSGRQPAPGIRLPRDTTLIVTCEHGGNLIPARFRKHFRGAADTLHSHRGWDAGALVLAGEISKVLDCPLYSSRTSRLLVDLNRSTHHPGVLSEFTRGCNPRDRAWIFDHCYHPYRKAVEQAIRNLVREKHFVLHLSAHSFTPEWHGEVRNADVGFLYDPGRSRETALSRLLVDRLRSDWRVRRNYPYRGTADGFTTWLRKRFSDSHYAGIEIEINQAILASPGRWKRLRSAISGALQGLLDRRAGTRPGG